MPRRRRYVRPEAEPALDRFKYEVADDLGLGGDIRRRGWENMTTREVGRVGGNMVRQMIKRAEREMGGEEYAAEWAETPAADRDSYPGLRRPGPEERRRYVERGRRDRRA